MPNFFNMSTISLIFFVFLLKYMCDLVSFFSFQQSEMAFVRLMNRGTTCAEVPWKNCFTTPLNLKWNDLKCNDDIVNNTTKHFVGDGFKMEFDTSSYMILKRINPSAGISILSAFYNAQNNKEKQECAWIDADDLGSGVCVFYLTDLMSKKKDGEYNLTIHDYTTTIVITDDYTIEIDFDGLAANIK